MPSPKFSSALGDDIGEDEEKNEIIRSILYSDHQSLINILSITSLDITQIRDEMGYNLVHLSAYNNSEKCMEALFHHVLNNGVLTLGGGLRGDGSGTQSGGGKHQKQFFAAGSNDKSEFEIIHAISRRALLKDWIN